MLSGEKQSTPLPLQNKRDYSSSSTHLKIQIPLHMGLVHTFKHILFYTLG